MPPERMPTSLAKAAAAARCVEVYWGSTGSLSGAALDIEINALRNSKEAEQINLVEEYYKMRSEILAADTTEDAKEGHGYTENTYTFKLPGYAGRLQPHHVSASHNFPVPTCPHIDLAPHLHSARVVATDIYYSTLGGGIRDPKSWAEYRAAVLTAPPSSKPNYLRVIETYLGRPLNPHALAAGMKGLDEQLEGINAKYGAATK